MKTLVELPLLPLRDVVVYPHMVIPLFVGREKSIEALEAAMTGDKQILLLAQKTPRTMIRAKMACTAWVRSLPCCSCSLPDGTVKVLVEGEQRGQVERFIEEEGHIRAAVQAIDDANVGEREAEVFTRSLLSQFEQYVQLGKKVPAEVLSSLNSIDEPSRLVDTMAAHMALKIEQKQDILEITDLSSRVEHVLALLDAEIDLLQVEKRIRGRVKKQMERSQREYYLNEQMKAIQKELGDIDEGHNEVEELKKRIDAAGLTKEAHTKATAELNKLKQMSPMSAEATVVRSYIDWLLNVPWKAESKVRHDLAKAEDILDADHYGLEEVKERILEYLAVQKRVKKLKGPVLCLVGPPGVGKTSLAESIARATNRKFVRMALGGVRDEAEIRGHRRTYIGSMPGRLIQKMTKVGVRNPLFLLDEIDKMGSDMRGSRLGAARGARPGAEPQLQRSLPGSRLRPVRRDVPLHRELDEHPGAPAGSDGSHPPAGLHRGREGQYRLQVPDSEAGPGQRTEEGRADLRGRRPARHHSLLHPRSRGAASKRQIAKVCRKAVKEHAKLKRIQAVVSSETLENYLGVRKFRYGLAEQQDQIGQVTGLAWTQVGGELLTIEAAVVPGKGQLTKTGSLGDVMAESITAALTVVRSRAQSLGIAADFHEKRDIHIHVPEGATPKDGPSAGIGMCTALVSAITQIPVRADVAMTGEITLRGQVLAIGGLKENFWRRTAAGSRR